MIRPVLAAGFFIYGIGQVKVEMKTTNKMSLRVWNSLDDDFDHEQLADNWAKLDAHDHSPGRGVPISSEGIFEKAITEEKLATAIVERLFATSETYGTEVVGQVASKAETVSGHTIIQATAKLPVEKCKLEIKVAGSLITSLALTPSTNAAEVPLHFFVPNGSTWEWVKKEGTITFNYRAIKL